MFNNKYKKVYTSQQSDMDCGVAALCMILKNYGSYYSLNELQDMVQMDLNGTSVKGIVKAAQKLGFDVKAIKANEKIFDYENIPFPFIVHVKKKEILHYYVIFEFKKKGIIIGDPDAKIGISKITKTQFLSEWDGICIFFNPTIDYNKRQYKGIEKNGYGQILKKQKLLILGLIILSLVITAINISSTYFLQFVIDNIIIKKSVFILTIFSISFIVVYICQSIAFYYRQILITLFGQKISVDISLAYIRHVICLPMSFFTIHKTGEIVSRFNDSNKITDTLGNFVVSSILDIAMIIIVGIFLYIQNLSLSIVVMMVFPIYIAIIILFSKPFNELNYKTMESGSQLNSSIIDALRGIETIKSINSEDKILNSITLEFNDLLKKSLSFSKIINFQYALKLGLDLIVNIVVIWFGAQMVIDNRISVGHLVSYSALLNFFLNPLQNLLELQPKLQTAIVADRRLNEVYLVSKENSISRIINDLELISGDIEIKNLNFQYGLGKKVLKGVSFKIKENEKIALVGLSGSGKSTIAKLLNGFIESENIGEEILVNGHNVKDIERNILRNYINYVPQSSYIFSGTILENLTLGCREEVSESEILNAVEIAEIKKDIECLPEKYHTKLRENSLQFSEGQKQRLVIARAVLSKAKVLILDESTSNLDIVTEKKIISNLLKLNDRTIIFIAHRMSVVKKINNIIVLDSGKIIESGNHDELLKLNGIYSKIFKE
ncbi:peptide cleavage/export ABC transporter [Streptococcus salivarius]|uniref:peptide cleavage/export ABC transporter n=1 Tax=Streptococcus salivarius TaxID=1304 RepID=UPI00352E1D31